ncbi:MAG: Jag N-terminal domain-containing protein [Actinomycetes bacterium]
MEWVETTAKTVDEAKELALDQLGVDQEDAEFELLEEPKTGLFGRPRGDARVRARILPKSPRAKTERKRRPRKEEAGSVPARSSGGNQSNSPSNPSVPRGTSAPRERSEPRRNKEPMDQAEQCTVVEEFLTGLAESFGFTASATAVFEDEDLRVNLTGEGLGVMVGPRLVTLEAIQEITRNTLQRQAAGREYGRVTVDIEGIRERRKLALSAFVTEQANSVTEGTTVAFEVMSSADRKQVHDVASELDGITSVSEGEDPRRRVVLKSV